MSFVVLPETRIERVSLAQDAFLQAQILWLDAPAGFGKSVLMAEYAKLCQQQKKITLSLTLAPKLNACEFLRLLFQACQLSLPGFDAQLNKTIQESIDSKQYQQALLYLLEELNKSKSPVLLAVDNVHHLTQDAWPLLLSLIELLPSKVQLFLAGRYVPEALGRVRLISGLKFLKEKDLKVTDTQLQKYLYGFNLKDVPATVAKLSRYLQGWFAGLVIWKNALKENPKVEGSPELIQSLLEDYVQGEMLNELDESSLEFLRLCALLKRFDEAMIQHFYVDDSYHRLLQQGLRLNFFSLQASWYEMHPVLAQFLASSWPLQQRMKIHRQAFSWLSTKPHLAVVALQHALSAQMNEEIQGWVMQKSEEIFANLDIAVLLEWFSTLNVRTIYNNSRLLALACWAYLLTHQREQAGLLLNEIERQNQLRDFELLALKGALARLDNQLDMAVQYCAKALERAPKERLTLRIYMCSILSQICLAKGRSDEARIWNAQTQELAHQSRATALEALSLLDALRIDMQRGSFISAQSLLTRSLALFSERPSQSEPLPLGRLYLYQAWFLWLSGEQDALLTRFLQEGIRLCTNLRDVSVCYGYAIRALRFAYREEYQHALDEVDSAQWLMQRWSVEPKSYLWLDFLRINLWLNQGQLARAKQALDRHLSLGCAALPQTEIFPMLPRLALLTQARWLLLSDKKKECLAYLEKESSLVGSALGQGLTEMIRAQAMRAFYPNEAQRTLSNIVRFMQRENLSQELLFWLPGLRESLPNKTDEVTLSANLSERELDVLRKIAQGLSNQEIADALFISLHTVKTHARKINTKLAAKNRTQALHKAQALKLI